MTLGWSVYAIVVVMLILEILHCVDNGEKWPI